MGAHKQEAMRRELPEQQHANCLHAVTPSNTTHAMPANTTAQVLLPSADVVNPPDVVNSSPALAQSCPMDQDHAVCLLAQPHAPKLNTTAKKALASLAAPQADELPASGVCLVT